VVSDENKEEKEFGSSDAFPSFIPPLPPSLPGHLPFEHTRLHLCEIIADQQGQEGLVCAVDSNEESHHVNEEEDGVCQHIK